MSQTMNSSREHGALRQHIVDQLREEIISGDLAPGTPIRTEAVMERFGVSNSPLREAFAQLAVEGLIEVYRNKGAVVSPLTRDGSADLIRVTALLMENVYSWAIPRLSGSDLAPVRRAAGDFELAYRSGDYLNAATDVGRFEKLVIERCGSAELERMVFALEPKVRRVRHLLNDQDSLDGAYNVVNGAMQAVQANEPQIAVIAVRAFWADFAARLDLVTSGFIS